MGFHFWSIVSATKASIWVWLFLGITSTALAQTTKLVVPPPARQKELPRPAPDQNHEKKKQIIQVLKKQEEEWNRGDLVGYMAGYWNSDTLRMVTNRGVTYGYDKVLANYRKNYPDSASMGKLEFNVIHVELIGDNDALVTGKWLLKVDKKFKGGFFTLLFRKIKNRWLIVADHTS